MSQRYIGGLIYNPPGGFSGYFDGSGDYLTIADNIALDMEGSDFTIEGWIFPAVSSGGSVGIFSKRASGAVVGGVLLYYNGAGLTPSLLIGSGGSWVINQASSIAFTLGQWNHFAVVRNGTSFVLYINGVAGVSATSSSSVTDNSAAFAIGAWAADGTGAISASYISNFRVVKGTAVYTSAFTPPNGPLQAITNTSLLTCAYGTFRDGSTNNFTITVNGNTAVSTQNPFPLTTLPNPALGNQGNGIYSMSQYQSLLQQNLWPAVDPYWEYVTLMLHGNGTNGAQNNTFLDSSTNNFTITRNGNTTQGTFSPYGTLWSNYFDNSGDSLTLTSNAAFAPGTGDFTVEAWIYPTVAWATWDGVFVVDVTGGIFFGKLDTGFGLRAYATANIVSTTAPDINKWTHVAVSRSGTTVRLFIDGALAASATSSQNFGQGTAYIGNSPSPGEEFGGYISNLRVVKGTAVYTSAFTPSTSPLTAITNTSLLTCQSNRFIDNSTNAFTITRNGDVSVQRFSPFNPTAPYSAATIGGSGYFDGSGDWLNISSAPPTSIRAWAANDFTVEAWVYPTSFSGWSYNDGQIHSTLIGNRSATTASDYWSFGPCADGVVRFYYWNGSTPNTVSSGLSVPLNQWSHVAFTKTSSGIRFFVNGVASGFVAINGTPVTGSDLAFTVGLANNTALTGYIGDLRIVNGTAVYSGSTYTVPTGPLTAITNTSLLLNFTNGGIIDNAMMNDLETVGNAQISTSVSKFGGGSMAFDGTGDYLFAPSSPQYNITSGAYTVEMWLNFTSASGTIVLFGFNGKGTTGSWQLLLDSGVLYWQQRGSSSNQTSYSWSPATSTWYHLAVSWDGTTLRIFVNGTSVATNTVNPAFSTAQNGLNIGGASDGYSLNGYIDDLRITKGYARYTANFTPQRSQWQDQ